MEIQTLFNELQEIKKMTLIGSKNVLTMDDVSLITGLSKSTIYKMTSLKKIPHYKSAGGKITYFDKKELELWQKSLKVQTEEEIEQKASNYLMSKR